MKRAAYIFILFLFPALSIAQLTIEQKAQVDSLKNVVNNSNNDTNTIHALNSWYKLVVHSQPKTAYEISLKMNKVCDLNLKKQLTEYEQSFFMKAKSMALNGAGIFHKHQGNIAQALTNYFACLKILETLGNHKGAAGILNNIGLIYKNEKEFSEALKTFEKSLSLLKRYGDTLEVASCLNNIGNVYYSMKDSEKAIKYFNKSLNMLKKAGDKYSIAMCLLNIGDVYSQVGNYIKSEEYLLKSLSILQEIDDKYGIAVAFINLSKLYRNNNQYDKAIFYGEKALKVGKKMNSTIDIMDASNSLWKTQKKLGNYKEALTYYELYIESRDSLELRANQKEVIRQQYKYEYEKQAAADSVKAAEAAKVKDAQLAAQRAENARQQQQAYYLYGGLALALLFGGFIFNRFRVTRKQKKVIEVQKVEVEKQREFADSQRQLAEEQKAVVEEKNREIIDSINYAKRLQEAILPPQKLVKEYLQQSFILYKPKDIVAGDFYWMECPPAPKGGKTIFFAAADCTGHGVPGAMVSVVCSNALSKALIEENITDVGQLLDRTRELVVERFGRSEENIQDGMDISLCKLEVKNQKSKVKLQYAGANNPLWVIRKGATEVEETKADKQPIGKYDKEDPFTAHTLQLNQGDSLYIFSDGYPDQFGGPKGKKYKTGTLKKFLLSIQDKDMATQRQLLNEEFENWKGELEQIDDVCVIGVRV